jgi:cytoskeletal protein CcmA (bactofilin family)
MANKGWGSPPRHDQAIPMPSAGPEVSADSGRSADRAPSSVIGADIIVTGDIEASVDLLVEGQVKGNVRCQTLLLGANSAIKGNIYAMRVRVSGTVEGAIEASDVAVENSGVVTGDIVYARLKVSTGATIDGTMKCNREAEAKLKLVETPAEEAPIVIE